MKATAIASPNMAIIKYWGKRNDELKLPMNDSIAVMLEGNFKSTTTVEFSGQKEDRITIDGVKADEKEMRNASLVLDHLRKKASSHQNATINSKNSFPKGTGIASSSSGYAAMAVAASKALGLNLSQKELSIAARLGSGSACRSMISGFSHWHMGERNDGSDSYATQIEDENHWKDLRIITIILSTEKKAVGSNEGMKRTVETSGLYKERLRNLPKAIRLARKAIITKDEELLYHVLMRESNSLHAVMLDSWPPITYLNDESKKIMAAVDHLNGKKLIAGYTFDAGPNGHVFTTQKNSLPALKAVKKAVPAAKAYISRPGPGAFAIN